MKMSAKSIWEKVFPANHYHQDFMMACRALFLIPCLIIVGVLVPRTLFFVPALCALGGYIFYALRQKEWLFPDRITSIFLALITLLSFASFLWAAFPDNALDRSYTTAGLMFSGFILLAVAQKAPSIEYWSLKTLAISCTACVTVLSLFFASEYLDYRFTIGRALAGEKEFMSSTWNRSMVVLILTAIPTLFLLYKAYGKEKPFYCLALITLASLAMPLTMTQSQTAQIMAAAGLIAFVAARIMRKYIAPTTGAVLVCLVLAAPWVPRLVVANIDVSSENPSSFVRQASMAHRLEVWDFVAQKIHERPIVGYGVESVRDMKSDQIMPMIKSDSILHPHNAFLQIWVEMGVIGALLACALMIYILRSIGRAPEDNQPLYYAVFISSLSLLATGYGLWQSWQIGLLLSISALCIIIARIPRPAKA